MGPILSSFLQAFIIVELLYQPHRIASHRIVAISSAPLIEKCVFASDPESLPF